MSFAVFAYTHDGDNFLGGRDFDLAIVDWLIALGAPFGSGLDPMLLVAQGAALFAATAALDARPKPKSAKAAPSGPRLWMQYPAMTPDTSPFVVGRALEGAEQVEAVRFVRLDGEWSTEWMPLEADATFSAMLALDRRSSSRLGVEVRLPGGRVSQAHPQTLCTDDDPSHEDLEGHLRR